MVGITAIISSIIGVFSAIIPKGFEYVDKRMTFQQELAIRKMEAEAREKEQAFALSAQSIAAQAKMEESYFGAVAAVDLNAHQYAEQSAAILTKPTGYKLLDVLNAAMRPLITIFIMGLFAVALTSWMFGVGAINADFGREMGVLFGSCVEAVIFFVFGRSAVRQPKSLATDR